MQQLLALIDRLDEAVVRQVFTHSSQVGDRGRSYERMEFLGDSVLSLCVTNELFHRFPHLQEGQLARVRAYVVSRETCAKVALDLDLGRRFRQHAPQGQDPAEVEALSRNSNVLADLTEALIGAIYATYGFEAVRPAVVEAFAEHITFAERGHIDSKTELQELLAKSSRTVVYRMTSQTGPAHDRRFAVEAVVGDEVLGRGSGPSKKRAEQQAASEALTELSSRERQGRRRVKLLARRRPAAGEVPEASEAPAVIEPAPVAGGGMPADASVRPAGESAPAGDETAPAEGTSARAGSRTARRRRSG